MERGVYMGNREEFEKNIKSGKGLLIAAILMLIAALSGVLTVYLSKKKIMDSPVALADAKIGDYASVDVKIMDTYFATNDYTGVEHKTYFVSDGQYIYIVDINDKNREALNAIYDYSFSEDENKEEPETVTLHGMAKSIPSDLKKIAIDAYNEIMGEKVLNATNFKDYLGTVYLDTYETPLNTMWSEASVGIIFVVIGGFLLFAFYRVRSTTKKSINRFGDKWDTVLQEIDSSDCFYYKKAKLYLTKSYLISYQSGLEVFDYKDIVWIYPHEYRYNGSVSQKSIFIVMKNGKARKLATVSASKKNLVLFDEMYNTFLNRMPDVLSGYTKENKEKAKELYQK